MNSTIPQGEMPPAPPPTAFMRQLCSLAVVIFCLAVVTGALHFIKIARGMVENLVDGGMLSTPIVWQWMAGDRVTLTAIHISLGLAALMTTWFSASRRIVFVTTVIYCLLCGLSTLSQVALSIYLIRKIAGLFSGLPPSP